MYKDTQKLTPLLILQHPFNGLFPGQPG